MITIFGYFRRKMALFSNQIFLQKLAVFWAEKPPISYENLFQIITSDPGLKNGKLAKLPFISEYCYSSPLFITRETIFCSRQVVKEYERCATKPQQNWRQQKSLHLENVEVRFRKVLHSCKARLSTSWASMNAAGSLTSFYALTSHTLYLATSLWPHDQFWTTSSLTTGWLNISQFKLKHICVGFSHIKNCVFNSGLPDGIFSNQKSQFG
jgi:hypothetical protein